MRVTAFIAAALSTLLAAAVALPATPASAQQPAVPRYGEKDKDKTWGEMEREKEAARAYKRSLDSVPEKGPVDPWGNARNVGEPKGDAAKAAPPKPKGKTGEAAK
ncbi:hypothetical protein [Bradyrhizobium sp.]|jgi:hypothetical protein|uniref:hypothetical protein n=1 Tax=Bradyrhizobium sp. TaxID=376 RepID=UPI002E04AE45|nr:hypothetical protein [Bradyrhizobium sp.]